VEEDRNLRESGRAKLIDGFEVFRAKITKEDLDSQTGEMASKLRARDDLQIGGLLGRIRPREYCRS
jgi:hypothetical protein